MLRFITFVLIMLSIFALPLKAQESLDKQTFVTEDDTFTFEYPAGWYVEVINADYGPNAHISLDNLPLDQRFDLPDGLNLQISLPKKPYEFMFLSGETPGEMVAVASGSSEEQPTIEFATPSASGTPQPLQLHPRGPEIIEFQVDGRASAYAYNVSQTARLDASRLFAVIDLGNEYWVTVSATSFVGGLETIQRYESVILEILQSMRYAPPPTVYSGNPELPHVYSGPVGMFQSGSIEFHYPEGWYVSSSNIVLMSNRRGNLLNTEPENGQFIALVEGALETRIAADPAALFGPCDGSSQEDLTARRLVEKLLGNITPAQIEQMESAGITTTQPEIRVVDGIEIVYVRVYQGDFEILQMFVDLGDGQIPSMVVTAYKEDVVQFEDQLFAVAATFQYTPKVCNE